MVETGHNSFRTSIQWSRLIPDGTGAVNPKAVSFYNDYFDELINNGIEPFVNLYHFDMPMALQEKRRLAPARDCGGICQICQDMFRLVWG